MTPYYDPDLGWPRKEREPKIPRTTVGRTPTAEPLPLLSELPPDVVEQVLSAYAREVALDPEAEPRSFAPVSPVLLSLAYTHS